MRAAWEQRADESATAFAWFVKYRGLAASERSIARLVSDAGRLDGKGTAGAGLRRRLEAWSARFEWQRRCRSWDGYVDERVQQDQLATARRDADRQAAQVSLVIQGATLPAVVLAERIAEGEEEAVKGELRELPTPALLQLSATCTRGLDRLLTAQRDARGWQRDVTGELAREAAELAREAARRGEPETPEDLWAAVNHMGQVAAIMSKVGALKPGQEQFGEWAEETWPDA